MLLPLVILVLAQQVPAVEYLLVFEKECSGQSGEFECKRSSDSLVVQLGTSGQWRGVNPSGTAARLELVAQDRFRIVLKNPVLFPGESTLHLIKATGRFYWTEIAYSDLLRADEATIRTGRIVVRMPKE